MIKILIADDHPIVLNGLKQILSDESSTMKVTGEASNAREIFKLLEKNEYDILILDIGLPDINGMEVLTMLRKSNPKLKVLVLSGLPEEQYAMRAVKSGALGFMHKETAPEELVDAIRTVISGRKYLSSSFKEKTLMDIIENKDSPLHKYLSEREFEIFCMLGSGMTVSEIGEKLYLSISTVSTYRSRVLQKMGMKNNAEIMKYCVKENLSI
jgi:DNA-binding NarL/FixJ family response regulator